MIWLFILCCVGAIAYMVAAGVNDVWEGFFYGWSSAGCVLLAIMFAIIMWKEPSPNAMDVYRGRTTLEITYRDSVALDSVVVFKDELKEQQQ